jgi:hypothetical protein
MYLKIFPLVGLYLKASKYISQYNFVGKEHAAFIFRVNGRSMFIRKAGKYLPDYTAS